MNIARRDLVKLKEFFGPDKTWEDQGAPVRFVCFTSKPSSKRRTVEDVGADGPV